MNESWKRLIEVERRLAALDTSIYRTNQSLLRSSAAIRNDAMNVPDPFGTGGGGGGGTSSMVRFPTSFTVRVTWTVAPTLINAASSNVAADGPELTAAATAMVTGFVCDKTSSSLSSSQTWAMSLDSGGSLYQRAEFSASSLYGGYDWATNWKLNKFEGNDFYIDYEQSSGTAIDVYLLGKTPGDQRFYLSYQWPRRNFAGAVIGTDTIYATRTYASTDQFSTGPTYGQSGTWSFAMECPATTYHNAGSGTIYLDW